MLIEIAFGMDHAVDEIGIEMVQIAAVVDDIVQLLATQRWRCSVSRLYSGRRPKVRHGNGCSGDGGAAVIGGGLVSFSK